MQSSDDYTTHVSVPPPPEKRPPRTVSIWFVVLFAVIGVLIGAVLILTAELYRAKELATNPPTPAPSSPLTRVRNTPTPQPSVGAVPTPTPATTPRPVLAPPPQPISTPQVVKRVIVPPMVSVPPGQLYSAPFNVPNGGGHVVGWFSTNHDIVAAIVDEAALRAFIQPERFFGGNIYYSSQGRKARDGIDVWLSPGTYYMVFSNKYAQWYVKNVSSEIYLEQ